MGVKTNGANILNTFNKMKTIILISENIPEEVANLMEECPKGSIYAYAVKKLGKQREFKNNLKDNLLNLRNNPPKDSYDDSEVEAWLSTLDAVETQLERVTARCRTLHRVCKYLYDMRY